MLTHRKLSITLGICSKTFFFFFLIKLKQIDNKPILFSFIIYLKRVLIHITFAGCDGGITFPGRTLGVKLGVSIGLANGWATW